MFNFISLGATAFITCRVWGGNVFVVCVCVCVCIQAITFEGVDIETSFLVWCDILIISRSSLSIKVIGSRSSHENIDFAT